MANILESSTTPIAKRLDLSKPPKLVSSIGLASCCRSAKWCADGNAVLTMSEDRSLAVWTPEGVTSSQPDQRTVDDAQTPYTLSQARSFIQGSPVYDTAWYPFATPTESASYCFLASIRDTPVKLIDAGDGRIRASYRIVDHRERFVAPHSLAFNLTAQKFYCGFLDAIEVFDLAVPGEGTRLLTIPTKRSKDGLRGIISSLAFCPDYSGLYAAGTFNSSIGLFSEDTGAQVLMYLDGVSGPISHLQFHPTNPHLLFASCRNRKDIHIWDVRNTSHLYSTLDLGPSSNQRRRFDIDPSGHHLITGDEEGRLRVYDVSTVQNQQPVLVFPGHEDAVSTATFHPTLPYLLTVSGSYKFPASVYRRDTESDASTSDDDGKSSDGSFEAVTMARTRIGTSDSSMKLWGI